MDKNKLKVATIKALIVLCPSYAAAIIGGQMIYVVPVLVAAGFFAANVEFTPEQVATMVEDETDEGDANDAGDSQDADNG